MKKLSEFIIILAFIIITASFILTSTALQAGAQESILVFTVERLVIAGSVENREPVGVVDAFASTTEKVYCFLEARDITKDANINFIWYHGDEEMARIELPLRQGPRWRTYSSKKIAGLKGNWKVELQDEGGTVLQAVEFMVE
jgi:hypothetical protein